MAKHTAEKCRKMEIRKDAKQADSQKQKIQNRKFSLANNNEKQIQPQYKVVRVCV